MQEQKKNDEKYVFLAIKYQWQELVFKGEKTIDIRKHFVGDLPKKTKMFLCDPDKSFGRAYTGGRMATLCNPVVGSVDIEKVENLEIEKIRDLKDKHCVNKYVFDSYFEGYKKGYAIHISNPVKFKKEIHIYKFGLQMPHSFQCVSKQQVMNFINKEQSYLDEINKIL